MLETQREVSNVEKELIENVRQDKISHAYLLEGDFCSEKEIIARKFIKAVICEGQDFLGCNECTSCVKFDSGNYEDFIHIQADGNSIKDKDIERMQQFLKNKPFYGERNIALISDADSMTLWAQNRLLKTLEEPPTGTIIMLLSENIENIIKTIRSRCTVYRVSQGINTFSHGAHEMIELSSRIVEMLLRNKPFYQITEEIKPAMKDRESAISFLDALENEYGRILKSKDDASRLYPKEYIFNAISAIEEERRNLRRNTNFGYSLKHLILKIGAK